MESYDSSTPNRYKAKTNPRSEGIEPHRGRGALRVALLPHATLITVVVSRNFASSCFPVPPTSAQTTRKKCQEEVYLMIRIAVGW
jgi:hypothetical protein